MAAKSKTKVIINAQHHVTTKAVDQIKQNKHLSFTRPQITALSSMQVAEIDHDQDFYQSKVTKDVLAHHMSTN